MKLRPGVWDYASQWPPLGADSNLPYRGGPWHFGPAHTRHPYYELQFPGASTRPTLERGFPSSLRGKEPGPREQALRPTQNLPPAPPTPRGRASPTRAGRRAAGGGRGLGGHGGGAGRGGGGAGPGSPAAWQRRWRPEPEVGSCSLLSWL